MTSANENKLAPLDELFLLLPHHENIILGQSRKLGPEGEDASLQRAILITTIITVATILFVGGVELLGILSGSISISLYDLLLIVFFIGGIYLNLRIRKRYKNKQILEREGILIPGKVIAAKTDRAVTIKGMKPVIILDYKFETPLGKQLTGKEAQLASMPIPQKDTPVAIIYKNDTCYRVL